MTKLQSALTFALDCYRSPEVAYVLLYASCTHDKIISNRSPTSVFRHVTWRSIIYTTCLGDDGDINVDLSTYLTSNRLWKKCRQRNLNVLGCGTPGQTPRRLIELEVLLGSRMARHGRKMNLGGKRNSATGLFNVTSMRT